jgi:hypothetical protein
MIPFIHPLPNGNRGVIQISRDPAIEGLAKDFLEANGRYLLEIQPDETVKLMAIIDMKDGATEVATEVSRNGIELCRAVDRLVEKSYAKMQEELPTVSYIKPRASGLILPFSRG